MQRNSIKTISLNSCRIRDQAFDVLCASQTTKSGANEHLKGNPTCKASIVKNSYLPDTWSTGLSQSHRKIPVQSK